MLVRRIARPLLASTFVYGGIETLRNPEPRQAMAEKLDIPSKPGMDRLNITSTEQAVKANAAVQVVAGSLLALGRFPRFASLALAASLVPTTAAGHRFWEEEGAAKTNHLIHFLKNASLIGGLLIASVDTEGKESLGRKTKRVSRQGKHRAEVGAAAASAAVASLGATATKASEKAAKKARKQQAAAAKVTANATKKVQQSGAAEKLHDLLPV